MTTSKFLLVALLSMRSTLGAPTAPLVATRQETSLGPRGFNGEGPATLINAVINYLAPKNAYDPDVPDKCVLSFSQSAGASCQARVQCDQTDALGPYSDPPVWSSCFLHGKYFLCLHHDHLKSQAAQLMFHAICYRPTILHGPEHRRL